MRGRGEEKGCYEREVESGGEEEEKAKTHERTGTCLNDL